MTENVEKIENKEKDGEYFPDEEEKVPEVVEPWRVSVEHPIFKKARTDVSDNGSYSDAEVNMNVATLGIFNRPFPFHFSGVYYDVLKEENPNIETSFRKFFLVGKIRVYDRSRNDFVERVRYIRFRLGSEMCDRISKFLNDGEIINGRYAPYRIITLVRRPNPNYSRFRDDESDGDIEDGYDGNEKGIWDIVSVAPSPFYGNYIH